MVTNKQFIAYLELFLSMIFLCLTFIMGKSLVTTFPIYILLTLRFLIGSGYFLVTQSFISVAMKKTKAKLLWRDWIFLFLQSFFGAFLFNLFMLFGLCSTTANVAAILTSTIPAFISIFSYLILKEPISRYKYFAIILSISGLILATIDTRGLFFKDSNLTGNFFVLFAVISGSLFPIFTKLLINKISLPAISLFFNLFGLLLFAPIGLVASIHFNFYSVSITEWLLAIVYGLIANVLYVIFWNRGLSIIPASTASLFTAIMPISTWVLSYVFLGDVVKASQIVGFMFVLMALIIGLHKA